MDVRITDNMIRNAWRRDSRPPAGDGQRLERLRDGAAVGSRFAGSYCIAG